MVDNNDKQQAETMATGSTGGDYERQPEGDE